MNQQYNKILGRCLEAMFTELNPGNADNPRYRLCHEPDRRDIVFSISEKAPPGQRFETGQNYKTWRGPTWQQCEQIAATSQSESEIIDRWRKLIFEGIDTTRIAPRITELQLEQKQEERMKELVQKGIQELIEKQGLQHLLKPIEPPQGIQKKIGKAKPKNSLAKLELWAERAKIMGLHPPTLTLIGNAIDKRWLKHAERRWDAHLQAEAAAAATGVDKVEANAQPAT